MASNMPISARTETTIGSRRILFSNVGTGTDPMATEPPQQRRRRQLEVCCDCTRHSTCSQATGARACACRKAGRQCTSCACSCQCRNRASRDDTGNPATGGLRAFFYHGTNQGPAVTAPSLLAAQMESTEEEGATQKAEGRAREEEQGETTGQPPEAAAAVPQPTLPETKVEEGSSSSAQDKAAHLLAPGEREGSQEQHPATTGKTQGGVGTEDAGAGGEEEPARLAGEGDKAPTSWDDGAQTDAEEEGTDRRSQPETGSYQTQADTDGARATPAAAEEMEEESSSTPGGVNGNGAMQEVLTEEGADLPSFNLTPADRKLLTVFGDTVHRNDGTHFTGGVPDNLVWQQRWRRLAGLPTNWYDTLSGKVGRRFVSVLTAKFQGVRERMWNSERVL
eukprot:6912780-Ditylum_brightwellii.AAC.1